MLYSLEQDRGICLLVFIHSLIQISFTKEHLSFVDFKKRALVIEIVAKQTYELCFGFQIYYVCETKHRSDGADT